MIRPRPTRGRGIGAGLACLSVAWLWLAGAAGGQVIERKGHRPPPPPAPETPLPEADAAMLAELPLERYLQVPREFESQPLEVEIFKFADPDSAFCAFTFLQKPGAKPFSERLDSIVQAQELLLWQGRHVCRTTFQNLTRAHLGAYADWLRAQLSPPHPAPAWYQKLPRADCRPESRRFITRNGLLALALGGLPPEGLTLSPGERLVLARYHHPGGDYWCGWHLGAAGATSSLQALPPSAAIARPALRLRPLREATALYLGPDPAGQAEAVLEGLQRALRSNLSTGGIDPSRFFRRDQTSYSQLIITSFKFVGVLFLLAAGCAAIVAGTGWLVRRFRHEETGLGREGLVWIRLVKGRAKIDQEANSQKSPHR